MTEVSKTTHLSLDEQLMVRRALFRSVEIIPNHEVTRLRGAIEQAIAHLEHGDLPEPATRALGILNEALS